MTAPFISTGDLSNLLGQDVTDDDLAVIAIDSACETVRSYIDQRLNFEEDDTVTLDGTGTLSLLLPQRPVVAVDELVVEDEDDVTWYRNGYGILYRTDGSRWTRGYGNITVTYDHGYAINEAQVTAGARRMPADIRKVALALAARTFTAGSSAGVATSETIGPESYQRQVDTSATVSQLLPAEFSALDHYRAPGVA